MVEETSTVELVVFATTTVSPDQIQYRHVVHSLGSDLPALFFLC